MANMLWTKNAIVIDSPSGYNVADYFPGVDVLTASTEQLNDAYLGEDADGVGVVLQ